VKLLVGLGNPGSEYKFSPHNMGFAVIDRLAQRHGISLDRKRAQSLYGRLQLGDEEVFLIQPQTFMNLSGHAVREWLRKQPCGPEELVVLHDELDLPWGSIQVRQRGGSAGHHGLESIIADIGTREFARIRIGVSPDSGAEGTADEDRISYLLQPVKRSLRESMDEMVDRSADAAEAIVREGVQKAMNKFNRRDKNSE
jgi:PTH1 family peptidyl-tRNA hydrolase